MTRWLGGISRLYADSRYPRGRILAASAVPVSGAGDTNENALATITVPAGAMGLNGRLRISTWWTVTGSGNNKTMRHRFSAIGGTAYGAFVQTTNTNFKWITEIANRGAANSQFGDDGNGGGGWTPSTSAFVTSSVDTSAATTLVITGQKASAGETLTLESYLVELIIPPG